MLATWRWVRRGSFVLGFGVLGLVGGCRATPPPSPTPRLGASPCPAPAVRTADRILPRRIRLVNETPDTVDVWIDRCFHHTRLATLPPDGVAQPRLPEPLLPFEEGLRIHTHTVGDDARYFGRFAVDLDPVPVLELVIRPDDRIAGGGRPARPGGR